MSFLGSKLSNDFSSQRKNPLIMAYKDLQVLSWLLSSVTTSSSVLSLVLSAKGTLASLLVLELNRHIPASGLLHFLFLLVQNVLSYFFVWFISSPVLGFASRLSYLKFQSLVSVVLCLFFLYFSPRALNHHAIYLPNYLVYYLHHPQSPPGPRLQRL